MLGLSKVTPDGAAGEAAFSQGTMASVPNHALTFHSFGAPVTHLRLESADLPAVRPGMVRVAMSFAPVNPSDLIPITGAYAHRIRLPVVAGYEGVGRVLHAPDACASLLGQRVLPLRGAGTWQSFVDVTPDLVVPVPDVISDLVAARAYINPLTAQIMLDHWPVMGKRVLLTGAGSMCAELLGVWAYQRGAAVVQGVYRSVSRAERLQARGIEPVALDDLPAVTRAARRADLTFDALGGPMGSAVLQAMREGTDLIGYGLLSGQALRLSGQPQATYHRFHLRDALATLTAVEWQRQFTQMWPALGSAGLPPVEVFALKDWKKALELTERPGAAKPVLSFHDAEPGA